MPPGCGGEHRGIVVAMSRKPETIGRQLVPLFARDLAGFAANADRRIGEKPHLAHQRFPLYIYGSSRATILPSCPRCERRPGRILQVNDFALCILTLRSATSTSKSLATSPVTTPLYPQWNGKPI